jgi:hypothetical protein
VDAQIPHPIGLKCNELQYSTINLRKYVLANPVQNIIMSERNKNSFISSICICFTVFFGLWTILSNVTVAVGGSLHELKISLVLFAPIVIGTILYCRNNNQVLFINSDRDQTLDFHFGWKPVAGICAGGTVLAFANNYLVFWFLATTTLLIAYLYCLRAPQLRIERQSPRRLDIFIFTFATAVAVLIAVIANRPDADDSFYLNLAVSAVDHPGIALFSSDTLHNIPGAFVLPIYRIHALELFYGLIADLTNQEPLVVAHLWLPPVFSAVSVLAVAMVLQILLHRDWAWATLSVVVIFVIAREVHYAYGNFAYVRIFQGKAILVTVMVPLIINYAMEFSSRPNLKNWILLALAQAGAIGMTSNAIYVAPLAAGLTLIGCFRFNFQTAMRFGLGLLASIYPICVGLFVKYQLLSLDLNLEQHKKYIPIAETVDRYFGEGPTRYILLGALMCSWMVVKDKASRLWLVAVSFSAFVLFFNPFLDDFIALNVTSPSLLWRLFWAVPVPIMAAILLCWISRIFYQNEAVRFGFFASCLIVALILLPITVGPGQLRVPQPAFEIARLLGLLADKGEYVLASNDVSPWVTTYRQHPFPVVSRKLYVYGLVKIYSKHVDVPAVKNRLSIIRYISGRKRTSRSSQDLEKIIQHLNIKAVALHSANPWCMEILSVLKKQGFAALNSLQYTIAYRNTSWPAGIDSSIGACSSPDRRSGS